MMRAWGVTDKGVVRAQNQDAYYVDVPSEELALCVVCDGMGGAKAGNVASRLAVDSFVDALRRHSAQDGPGEPEQVMREAAELANQTVHYRSGIDPECRGMGTTMVAALVKGENAHILNIGDSRCYRIGAEGIVRVTRDHSVVEDLVARGELTPEEARNHPKKNLITRALGSEEHVRADLYRETLAAGEFLLLCSDGLSNQLTDQEILYEVLHGGEADSCCQRLLEIALSRGAPDNVTVVLLQVSNQ